MQCLKNLRAWILLVYNYIPYSLCITNKLNASVILMEIGIVY